jgi:hypothetical protein
MVESLAYPPQLDQAQLNDGLLNQAQSNAQSNQARLTWQPSLLDGGLEAGFDGACGQPDARPDADFSSLVRHRLDDCCWVDHAPGWLAGTDSLFEQLLASGAFRQRERWMYERMVDEPRLVAPWPLDQLPPAIGAARSLLCHRYGVEFDSVLVNLYRDGRDSVAWHGDTVRKAQSHPMVVTISLGARRRFLLRPRGGGTSVRWLLGPGDLVVMGGRSQHDWEHCVPKMALAGPRASVTMRHSQPPATPTDDGSRR